MPSDPVRDDADQPPASRRFHCSCPDGHTDVVETPFEERASRVTLAEARCPTCGGEWFTATELEA